MIDKIRLKAFEKGFTGIGFSQPAKPLFFDEFKLWVSSGRNAGMSWMERNMDIREDPVKLLPGCRTIISLAYPYPEEKPSTQDGYTLARYSTPDEYDYHIRVKEKCRELTEFIEKLSMGSISRILVDSAPFLERSFAYSSGIGYIGKNNMLIIPGHGSYFYLAEILTTERFDIPVSEPVKDLCGSCSRCVDACPTGALKSPRDFDSSCCLSYLTIEDKNMTDISLGKNMNNCFLGCDICQEVCPHNKRDMIKKCMPSTAEILGMNNDTFIRMYGKTALSRPGLEKIKSNLKVILRC
jgi:epoxyqueuosine reductase